MKNLIKSLIKGKTPLPTGRRKTPSPVASTGRVCIIVAATLYTITAIVYVMWLMTAYRFPYPCWDAVDMILFIGETFLPHWNLSTAFHLTNNEHRPVFPLYIWAMDYSLFAADGLAVIILNILLLLVLSVLVMKWIQGPGQLNTRRIFLMASVPLLLFWPAQADNLIWSQQINFILSLSTMLLSLFFLLAGEIALQQGRKKAYIHLGASIFFLFLSSFSLSFGITAWPIFTIYLLSRRLPKLFPLIFGLATAVIILIFISLWVPLEYHADPLTSLLQPARILVYMFAFLGAPLHYILATPLFSPPPWLHITAGAFVSCLILLACYIMFFDHGKKDKNMSFHERALILVSTLMAACALVTALGRHTFGFDQALSNRYLLVSSLSWLGIAGYWIPRITINKLLKCFGYTVISAVTFALTLSYMYRSATLKHSTALTRIAAMASTLNITHPELTPRIYPVDGDKLERLHRLLRGQGHHFFTQSWQQWYKRNIKEMFESTLGNHCLGSIDVFFRIGSDIRRYEGWAMDQLTNEPPPYVIAVDNEGIIKGIGATGLFRYDVARHFNHWRFSNSGWYVLAEKEKGPLTIYAVSDDGKLCIIEQ